MKNIYHMWEKMLLTIFQKFTELWKESINRCEIFYYGLLHDIVHDFLEGLLHMKSPHAVVLHFKLFFHITGVIIIIIIL